jgi:hypothetical protein
MKERIDEHDMTKKMMDIMRGGYKPLLTEDETQPMTMGVNPQEGKPEESKDVITPVKGDAVFNDELKKLQDTVDPRVKITNFKIYPVDENIIIEGVFLQKEAQGTGIMFKMSLAAGEIETSMNGIELSDKVSLLLQKLKGYYENWVNEWALKLPNEYRPKQN